jgi:hypothetical protein
MKLTKSKLKHIIKEELDNVQQEGLFDFLKGTEKETRPTYKPSRGDFSHEEWHARTTSGELSNPEDQVALDKSYVYINEFLKDSEVLNNIERYKAMEELMRDLGRAMIYRTGRPKK